MSGFDRVFGLFDRYLLLVLILLIISGCSGGDRTTGSEDRQITGRSDTQLLLNNAILEQSNREENLLWKIKAKKTSYSNDRQVAYLEDITANLLENDTIILQLSGSTGEYKDNGNLIFLKGDIIVKDSRNQSVLTSDFAEWRPQENILIVKDNFVANHPSFRVEAKTGKYFTNTENLELTERVIGNTFAPFLQLKTESLLWNISEESIIGNVPYRLVRYDREIVTDRLLGERLKIDLKEKIVTLNNNIELVSIEPQLQIATNSATWFYENRLIKSDRPIQVIGQESKLNITGNKGEINLLSNIVNLGDGVKGDYIYGGNQNKIFSQQLTWNIPEQKIESIGNVIYDRVKPPLNLRGDRAIIKLDTNNAIVKSEENNKPVISVIGDR